MSASLTPLDAVATLRNVLQGLQAWLDIDACGKAQPKLLQAYVEHWQRQLGVVLAMLEGPRGHEAAPVRKGET